MTLSMVENSCDEVVVWRMADDADADAEALGTKAWEVDAEAEEK